MNWKTLLAWGSAIGISGGVVVTILVFALEAYIAGAVASEVKAQLVEVPTTISVNGQIGEIKTQLVLIQDGVDDNSTAIGEVKTSQDEIYLLFTDYLTKQVN